MLLRLHLLKANCVHRFGSVFVIFAIIGIWIPGWPTVSWAVPAAFLFSLSSKRLFRWSLTNRFFGSAIFDYYASGKTIPRHAKYGIAFMISIMTILSTYGVWAVSTRGMERSSILLRGMGQTRVMGPSILIAGIIGVWFVSASQDTRRLNSISFENSISLSIGRWSTVSLQLMSLNDLTVLIDQNVNWKCGHFGYGERHRNVPLMVALIMVSGERMAPHMKRTKDFSTPFSLKCRICLKQLL